MNFRLATGRHQQLRLPLSPFKAERALKALESWRETPEKDQERRWYKIGNQAGDAPTQVNIFDEISWWGISAQEFVDELAGISGAIEVHINSPGGDAFDGITIYNALAARGDVVTVVDGLAASAASVIAMAGQQRIMSPGSMMMIHDALALCIGNAADMRETAQLLDKVSDNIASVYAAHAGKTAAEWRAAMVAEGWYTAQEAVDSGLAHKLAARDGGDPEAQAHWDRSVFAAWTGRPAAADGNHAPMTGTHTHSHPDGNGGDHSHEHEHDGDASHYNHDHSDGGEGDGMTARTSPGISNDVDEAMGDGGDDTSDLSDEEIWAGLADPKLFQLDAGTE
jgi:ATP-dependent protease ClpP protease subunit